MLKTERLVIGRKMWTCDGRMSDDKIKNISRILCLNTNGLCKESNKKMVIESSIIGKVGELRHSNIYIWLAEE